MPTPKTKRYTARDLAAIKRRVTRERGGWNPLWDTLLEWDPQFLEAYLEFSSIPWRNGRLAPEVRELIYIAIDASTTHLYAPGVRRHIRNALDLGVSPEEILEVLQLVSVLGIHAYNLGVPILAEESGTGRAGKARSTVSRARRGKR